MMTRLDWLVLICVVPVVIAYLCRLSVLHYRLHKATVIAMHVALFISAIGVGITAVEGETELQDVLSLVGAGLWIVVSWSSWGKGVPPHALRRPLKQEQER